MSCTMDTDTNSSEIANFFNNKSIFITGATGFMGKVLVEKLLRSCPGIKTIYVLLRPKKGKNPKERLDELFHAKIFDHLKDELGNNVIHEKVISIDGDISKEGLGITEHDIERLITDVNIVFHSAATVKFDEPLKASIQMNVLGTRRVIQLCKKMDNLKALIHVSTAYANCNRDDVDEVLYPSPVRPQQIIDAVEWMTDDLVNAITPKLVGDRPNTYTYTKALAETLISEECQGLPVAIVRPSIVTAAWREPLRGWVDNFNGPTGLVLACGKGVLRTMLYDGDAAADLIPVDTVINLMITAAWSVGTTSSPSTKVSSTNNEQSSNQEIRIFNCTSGQLNCITWGDIERIAFPILLRYPSCEVFRYPGGSFKNSKLFNDISIIFEHLLPAYLVDTMCKIMGKKQIMVAITGRLHKAIGALEWFTTRQWHFECNNVLALSNELKGNDRKTFAFDIRDLHWPTYWEDYVLGIRKYILKEDISSLPRARKSLQRLYYMNKIIGIGLLIGVWQLFTMRTQVSRRMWYFFTSLAIKLYSLVTKPITN